jgi:hypothetical protein
LKKEKMSLVGINRIPWHLSIFIHSFCVPRNKQHLLKRGLLGWHSILQKHHQDATHGISNEGGAETGNILSGYPAQSAITRQQAQTP